MRNLVKLYKESDKPRMKTNRGGSIEQLEGSMEKHVFRDSYHAENKVYRIKN